MDISSKQRGCFSVVYSIDIRYLSGKTWRWTSHLRLKRLSPLLLKNNKLQLNPFAAVLCEPERRFSSLLLCISRALSAFDGSVIINFISFGSLAQLADWDLHFTSRRLLCERANRNLRIYEAQRRTWNGVKIHTTKIVIDRPTDPFLQCPSTRMVSVRSIIFFQQNRRPCSASWSVTQKQHFFC